MLLSTPIFLIIFSGFLVQRKISSLAEILLAQE